MDVKLLGEVTAKCMDGLEATGYPDDAELIACAIVTIVNTSDETFTRTYSSSEMHYVNLGLFTAALDCVRHGEDASTA